MNATRHFIGWRHPHKGERITHFQVFGERRSGTNFAERLLAKNLKMRPETHYGWKHGFPMMPSIRVDGLIVAIFRDPMSWLISLHNRPFAVSHGDLPFPEFLRKEWLDIYKPKKAGHAKFGYGGMPAQRDVPNQLDRHPITGKRFANPLEMRRLKNASYLGFLERECNVVLVDYAHLKENGAAVINAISDVFGIDLAAREFVDMQRVGPGGYDRPRQNPNQVSPEDLAFIKSNLDGALETRLGYDLSLAFDQNEAPLGAVG